jgi:hypothetical protein
MSENTDIAWFAGLIDGEGCFMFGISIRKDNRKTVHNIAYTCNCLGIVPHFTISMTPGDWEEPFKRILISNNIPFNYSIHHYMARIRVNGDSGVKKLCKLIYPYSVVKKPIIGMFIQYEGRHIRNQYMGKDGETIRKIATDVDFARSFNKKRNKVYKWTGDLILDFYGISR